jgi:hypothetical protein
MEWNYRNPDWRGAPRKPTPNASRLGYVAAPRISKNVKRLEIQLPIYKEIAMLCRFPQ